MGECLLYVAAGFVEDGKLLVGKFVKLCSVATYEMREDAHRLYCILLMQQTDKPVNVRGGVKSQAVHACIKLDVDGELSDAFALGSMNECLEQIEVVNLGLQIVGEEVVEGRHLRIHNHYVAGDTSLSQCYTFIGHGYSQIVHLVVLQGFAHFYASCSVG